MKYKDKCYRDKMIELKRYHNDSILSRELVEYIVYHSDTEDTTEFNLDKKEILRDILLYGYIAYLRVFDKYGSIISYSKLEPERLIKTIQDWKYTDIFSSSINYSNDEIVYISYDTLICSQSLSLVEEIMLLGLNKKDHQTYIELIIDNVWKIYEQFDIKYYRKKKLERILK